VNDATDLVPYVDTVLVVVRAGKTTTEAALRSAERLHRLGVDTCGVALLGSASAGRSAYYYNEGPANGPRPKPPRPPARHASSELPAPDPDPVDGHPAPEPSVIALPPVQEPTPAPRQEVVYPPPTPSRLLAPPPMARPITPERPPDP
jgi:hypothetical protein